jgi:WD40 repeat protein
MYHFHPWLDSPGGSMSKNFMLITTLLATVFLSACSLSSPQIAPTSAYTPLPTPAPKSQPEPATPTPTNTPSLPFVISAENAARLSPVLTVDVAAPFRAAISIDGSTIGIRSTDGLKLFNTTSGELSGSVIIQQPVTLVDFSPTSGLLATTSDQATIEIRELDTGNTLQTIRPDSFFVGAAFSPDGLTLAVALGDYIGASLYDVRSGQLIKTLTGFESAAPIYSVAFDTSGRWLIWWARGTVQLQNINDATLSSTFNHEDSVTDFALSQDGSLFATVSYAAVGADYLSVVHLWDTVTGTETGRLTDKAGLRGAAFSQDGKLIATSAGNTLIIYAVATRQRLAELQGSADLIDNLYFLPGGTTLVTISANENNIRFWQVR